MWTQVCCNNQSASEDVKVIVAKGPEKATGTGVFLKDLDFEIEGDPRAPIVLAGNAKGGAGYPCENM